MDATTCIEAEPFALRVTDDSMAPEFACGAIIIIDPTGRVTDGAYVLAELDSGYIFRQYRCGDDGVSLVALNGSYPAIALGSPPGGGSALIKGVVVQRAGTRRRDHKRYD